MTNGLPSACSADRRRSLFACFISTMPLSDSSQTCTRAVRPKPSPVGPHPSGRRRGLPVLVQKVSRRVWGLRLRRAGPGLALAPWVVWPSTDVRMSAPWLQIFEARYPAHLFPGLCFAPHLAAHSANSGPSVSLLPSRKDLSSSPSCRFIPVLSTSFCAARLICGFLTQLFSVT